MIQKLTSLLETRKLSALAIILLFIVLSLMGKLEVNFIQTVIISVVSFYFGQSTARDNPKKEQ
ncbi:hypothetical protein [Paenibacillus alkalitolerans]|uniref:hypothetical protein n=1 Tax=Paenibacillus alkalitolerans TaxID=2799335 RepID=UPI0018F2FEF5|nr:hypothetical protein [Paenibacillus alkalitolerans]